MRRVINLGRPRGSYGPGPGDGVRMAVTVASLQAGSARSLIVRDERAQESVPSSKRSLVKCMSVEGYGIGGPLYPCRRT